MFYVTTFGKACYVLADKWDRTLLLTTTCNFLIVFVREMSFLMVFYLHRLVKCQQSICFRASDAEVNGLGSNLGFATSLLCDLR